MRLSKSNNSKPGRKFTSWFSDEPQATAQPSGSSTRPAKDSLNRSSSVKLRRDRASVPGAANNQGDRRSIAVLSHPYESTSSVEGAGTPSHPTAGRGPAGGIPSAVATPTADALPPTSPPPAPQDPRQQRETVTAVQAPMSSAQGKTSSDSGQQAALDRWSQRGLRRLNTEQGFREQRQGGQAVFTPPPQSDASSFTSSVYADAQPPSSAHYPSQPNPLTQTPAAAAANSGPRTAHGNPALSTSYAQTPSSSGNSASRSASYQQHDSFHASSASQPSQSPQPVPQQYSPNPNNPHPQQHLAHPHHQPDPARPPLLNQSRSFSQQSGTDDAPPPMSNNGNPQASKALRAASNNRQSVHNGGAQVPPAVPAVNAPPGPQPKEVGRGTPQPIQVNSEDMTQEEVAQLIRDHKELRDKYTKVKKYYFEKEDQVKQLQNSLAHQRLSQSRTSLDDSEYSTRFSRLDGLIAQLAFSIRKNWRTIPAWLQGSVNKDAVMTGKQEMTAVGRAVISSWLVEEVFEKVFHPDLEPQLSSQLKMIQKNIRKSAPPPQSAEEDEVLTSRVVNWRLATLDGLGEVLRSGQPRNYRDQLMAMLNEHLVGALSVHLQDPPPQDLEGGVHMIVELVVSIAIHLPLESREVHIEYFPPNYGIVLETMKIETGIPPLTLSVADDAAERSSNKSGHSDITESTETASVDPPKKRGMLSALTGGGHKSKSSTPVKHPSPGNSSGNLNRPEPAQEHKEDGPPRVRMAAGMGVSIRGRSVLVKAPIFST